MCCLVSPQFMARLLQHTAVKEVQDSKYYPVFDANGDGTIGYRIYVFDGTDNAVKVRHVHVQFKIPLDKTGSVQSHKEKKH